MLVADVSGFAVAGGLLLALNAWWRLFALGTGDLKYLVIPLLCLVLFLNSKLYPGVGVSPAEEIKLVTQYVTTGFVAGWAMLMLVQERQAPNHLAFPVLWLLSILAVLPIRWGVRLAAVRFRLWGEPVVVIGTSANVEKTVRYFMGRRRLGYVPVLAVIDTANNQCGTRSVPVIESTTLLTSNADRFSQDGIYTALVNVPAISEFFRSNESKALFRLFQRVILISDVDWIDGASMRIQDFEGIIGIEAEKGTLTPMSALLKRTLDLVVATISGIVLLPLMVMAAIWIKLDSPGGVFYSQERVGKAGRKIKTHKFRSMFSNSESALQAYLREHAEARDEWAAKQKLCADPRVTRAGRFLRKFSIDEVPQLLNVLKGEMSLVGPRPLPEYHHHLLSESVRTLRATLRPGMTGMWQVSGRTDSGMRGMEQWDTYYVRNWSLWLDINILLRTVWVVLSRNGAY